MTTIDQLAQSFNEHKREDERSFAQLLNELKHNTNMTEGLVQQISGMASDVKDLDAKVEAHHEEMKPWLEAKIGLNLLWRWGISIPVVVAVLIGIKTLLDWLGFHK